MSVTTEALRTPPPSPEERPSDVPRARSARIGGLDGLRAIAVIAVILYHYLPGTAGGGFLGVDLFFVISGFLITTLLIRERAATGRIALGEFWRRRARRLLPALVTMVAVTSVAALAIGGEVLVGIGRQVLGAMTFSYNWIAIADGNDYFGTTAPELYRNLWSLAVEEQFYLLWPLLVTALLMIRSKRVRFWIVTSAAVAAAGWMIVLTFSGADPTRIYFGSDSHSLGLLLGAAVALSAGAQTPYLPATTRWRRAGRAIVRWTFMAPLLGLMLLAFLRFDDSSAMLTSLSVLFFTALAAAVIALMLQLPSAGRALDVRPLRWIGERSYGLYLWHWPVQILLMAWLAPDPANLPATVAVTLAAVGVTLGASVLSYQWVETPIRRLGLRGTATTLFDAARRGASGARAALLVVPIVAIALVVGSIQAVLVEPAESLAAGRIERGQLAQDEAIAEAEAAVPEVVPTPPRTRDPSIVLPPRPTGDHVTAIGDSVMLASLPELRQALPGLLPDAAVSRQMWSAPDLLRDLDSADHLRDYVVVALGTNGGFDAALLPEIREILGPDRKLVLVSAFADRDWTAGVNAALKDYAATDPQTALADWSGAIAGHTDLLAWDNIHPGSAGGRIYAEQVVNALDSLYVIPPDMVERLVPDSPPGSVQTLR